MKRYFLSLIFNIVVLSSVFGQAKELQCAFDYISHGYILAGFKILKDCANHSNAWAQFFIGQCYEYGYCTDKNPKEAFLYYRKTAEKGIAVAQYSVSRCYEQGIGTSINLNKALIWQKKCKGKFKSTELTFFSSIYNKGLGYPEHYNEIPYDFSKTSGTTIATNGDVNSNNTIDSNK